MSLRQILKANQIIAIVPDTRKAKAVKACFGGKEISPMAPASILRNHPNAEIYIDRDSAALLSTWSSGIKHAGMTPQVRTIQILPEARPDHLCPTHIP
jgi:hypothetical protein